MRNPQFFDEFTYGLHFADGNGMNPDAVLKPGYVEVPEAILQGLCVSAGFECVPWQGDDQSDIEKKGVDQIHSRLSILSNSQEIRDVPQFPQYGVGWARR
jgi:hypothetical protein